MKFEHDVNKSNTNKAKHGISFEEIQELWLLSCIEIQASEGKERRFLRIGMLKEKFYTCVYTMRGDVVRLISARRSRKTEERGWYYEFIKA